MSVEDAVQAAIAQHLDSTSDAHPPHYCSHEILVQKLARRAIALLDQVRKKQKRHADLLQAAALNYLSECENHTDYESTLFCDAILDSLKDDPIARTVFIACYDGICDFSNTVDISLVSEIKVSEVENAKKRIRRKARAILENDPTAGGES